LIQEFAIKCRRPLRTTVTRLYTTYWEQTEQSSQLSIKECVISGCQAPWPDGLSIEGCYGCQHPLARSFEGPRFVV